MPSGRTNKHITCARGAVSPDSLMDPFILFWSSRLISKLLPRSFWAPEQGYQNVFVLDGRTWHQSQAIAMAERFHVGFGLPVPAGVRVQRVLSHCDDWLKYSVEIEPQAIVASMSHVNIIVINYFRLAVCVASGFLFAKASPYEATFLELRVRPLDPVPMAGGNAGVPMDTSAADRREFTFLPLEFRTERKLGFSDQADLGLICGAQFHGDVLVTAHAAIRCVRQRCRRRGARLEAMVRRALLVDHLSGRAHAGHSWRCTHG